VAKKKSVRPRTEPAHGLLYAPATLTPPTRSRPAADLLSLVTPYLEHPLNDRQQEAFARGWECRLSLLWGPPGTGKTTVLAAVLLGWLEAAWADGRSVCVGVGASNYNAIDNVLTEAADLLQRRQALVGGPVPSVDLVRVRHEAAEPPQDTRLTDVTSDSREAGDLAEALVNPDRCLVVGGTWMQLGKLARGASDDRVPAARWFDLLLLDEASQLEVAAAAGYYLLLREGGCVVLAGDHRQLGPIYGFAVEETRLGLFDCIFSHARESHGLLPVALDRNYRTNDEISSWPRQRFYPEGYVAHFPARRLTFRLPPGPAAPPGWPPGLPWSPDLLRVLDPDLPVAVVRYTAGAYTLSNPFEAQAVAALACLYRLCLAAAGELRSDEEFWNEQLGIVTPHRAQISTIRNLLVKAGEMPAVPAPFVDTVDRFQGQERDLMIASYAVADRDFVRSEEEFILSPRRFNVTLTRARSKFVLFVSSAVLEHLPSDAQVARDAAHLQLFAASYCSSVDASVSLTFREGTGERAVECRLRGRRDPAAMTGRTGSPHR
jgi:hypothetical protein